MSRICVLTFVVFGFMKVSSVTEEGTTDPLRCYSCAATGGDNYCEDFETYENATKTNDPAILKNCTSPINNICIIETFSVLGAAVSHIRDCSDGHRFSFTSNLQNNRSAYDRLYGLDLNNETACVWDGQDQVCLSKCNTDFCNGPQINLTEINISQIPRLSKLALLVTFLWKIVQLD